MATDLVALLDATAPADVALTELETAALQALRPLLERLDEQLERLTGVMRPQALGLGGGHGPAVCGGSDFGLVRRGDAGDGVNEALDALYEPAVEASVQASLGVDVPRRERMLEAWRRADAVTGVGGLWDGDDSADDDDESAATTSAGLPGRLVPVARLLPVLLEELGEAATLQGSVASMPLTALFELLSSSRQSGCLHLRTPDELVRVALFEGRVVATSSSDPLRDRRLGDWLVADGVLEEAQVEAVAAAARDGKRLGAALVDAGLVSTDQLRAALRKQIQARFDRVLRAEDVAYAFVPDQENLDEDATRENLRELLLDSARRRDEGGRGT